MLQFIKEHNPKLDSSVYKQLQRTIEAGRKEFAAGQTILLDRKRAYKNHLRSTIRPGMGGPDGIPHDRPVQVRYRDIGANAEDLQVRAGRRPNQAEVSMFSKGDRIELVSMTDDPNPIPPGTQRTVVDSWPVDLGPGNRFTQVSVKWDNGSNLLLTMPPDRARRI